MNNRPRGGGHGEAPRPPPHGHAAAEEVLAVALGQPAAERRAVVRHRDRFAHAACIQGAVAAAPVRGVALPAGWGL